MKGTILKWAHLLTKLEFWQEALAVFECLGPAVPILLAMVESFIPALPLVAIVTLNVAAHGTVLGFLYSWIGSATGSVLVFLFWRHIVKRRFWRIAARSQKLQKAEAWVNNFDRTALFLLATMPFTPSSFLNLAFGISDFDERRYIYTIVAAKSIMIALLALFGQSLVYALEQPLFLVLALAVLGGLYGLSKVICKKNHLE